MVGISPRQIVTASSTDTWKGAHHGWSALDSEDPGFWTATLLVEKEDSVGRPGGPGRRGYPAEFRRRVVDLLATGRKVADVARDLGVSEQAIYGWRRQERIDC